MRGLLRQQERLGARYRRACNEDPSAKRCVGPCPSFVQHKSKRALLRPAGCDILTSTTTAFYK